MDLKKSKLDKLIKGLILSKITKIGVRTNVSYLFRSGIQITFCNTCVPTRTLTSLVVYPTLGPRAVLVPKYEVRNPRKINFNK